MATPTASPLQTHRAGFSPLDQIALNAGHGQGRTGKTRHAGSAGASSSKQNLFERAAQVLRQDHPRRPEHAMPVGEGSGRRLSAQQEQIQAARAARMQQQHLQLSPGNFATPSQRLVRSAQSSPLSTNVQSFDDRRSLRAQTDQDGTLGLGNAFRDSMASNASFSSISGSNDRASIMGFGEEAGDDQMTLDRIADEVRGLDLRRRVSVDTVRSSEFGDGGRWANAWGTTDDDDTSTLRGSDDEDDDEDVSAASSSRAVHDISEQDIENASGPSLSGLGLLHRPPLAKAVTSPVPTLKQAGSVEHFVTLTPSMRSARQAQQLHPSAQAHARRDTVFSLAGDIISGDVSALDLDGEAEESGYRHERTLSSSTISAASEYSSANSHVHVWPPTPSGSDAGMSAGRPPLNFARPLRSADSPQATRSAEASGPLSQQHRPQVPMNPSAALAEPLHQPMIDDAAYVYDTRQPNNTYRYADPNLPSYPAGLESLGERRRQAIADHDGRESLVSDLDVETLRLDGSSNGSGSDSQDWDSRRASTSTVGTVSSITLEEQRRRRSQMEAINEGGDDRRQSTLTIRGSPRDGEGLADGMPQSTSASSLGLVRRASERVDPMNDSPAPPKRSNTQPHVGQVQPPQQTPLSGRPAVASPRMAVSEFRQPPHRSPITPRPDGTATPQSMLSPRLGASPQSPLLRSVSGVSMVSSPSSARRNVKTTPVNQSKAENFLTLGIQHHESGDLSRSAYYFERSAKIEGGCVVGMCMWGMALREGWGVRKDQKRGFDWISRAAARAGELMNGRGSAQPRTEAELKALRSELKLSVYELGKCFCYGWGVKMDKQMALEYFELAAKLGDADAQAEAGALLAAGKGCKKDLKKAAMYYRMAEAQGYDTVGLSWIHKNKYDPVQAK